MPRARYTGGGTYRVAGVSFEPGDEREVDQELAAYLSDHDAFEVTVEKEPTPDDVDDVEEDEPDSDDDQVEAFDAAAFVDRSPMDGVIEDIQAGEVDEHLDAVAEAADRVGVEDAVGERRAELEG